MATKNEQNDFAVLIEKLAHEQKITHLEAILQYCEESGLEIQVAASLVNANLKYHLRKDGEDLNLLSKSATLPL